MSRPQGSKNRPRDPELEEGAPWIDAGSPEFISPVKWSGIARSMECCVQNGFNNFRIITLTVDNGVVTDRKVSDPYASFEAVARMEIEVQKSALSLNFNYKDGKTWDQ